MAKKEETNLHEGNLQFYQRLRKVPDGALKKIGAGRLSGMSEINPVWRIQVMTETFGPCGIGWKYEIVKQWHEPFTYTVDKMAQDGQNWVTVKEERTEIKAFCNINLYIKVNDEWSEPIPGTGGSSFVAHEKNGPYVSDESEKMALTDALSVAMKALGVAADVYFAKGVNIVDSKYTQEVAQPQIDFNEKFESVKKKMLATKTRNELSELNNKSQDMWSYQPYIDILNEQYQKLPE